MSYYVHSYPGSNQLGGSLSEIEVYSGPVRRYRQDGGGIARYLASAIRFFKPLLSSGINALKEQGIESAGSILDQLGNKDVKSILKEEGQRAIKNLKQKALNKLNQTTGLKNQSGEGMPIYLHPYQARRAANILAIKPKKKAIKSGRVTKKKQKPKTHRSGSIKAVGKKSRQLGGQKGGKKRKSSKHKQSGGQRKQIGGKKKKKTTKKRKIGVNKQLDIFS